MHIIGLLDQPSSGRYWLDGVDVARPGGGRSRRRPEPQDRLRLPELQPGPPHHGPRQRRAPARLRRGSRPTGGAAAGARPRWRAVGLTDRTDHLPVAAVGRPAAAGGHRPGRSSPTRRSSWPTSRPATSTRPSTARRAGHLRPPQRARTHRRAHHPRGRTSPRHARRVIRLVDGRIVSDSAGRRRRAPRPSAAEHRGLMAPQFAPDRAPRPVGQQAAVVPHDARHHDRRRLGHRARRRRHGLVEAGRRQHRPAGDQHAHRDPGRLRRRSGRRRPTRAAARS